MKHIGAIFIKVESNVFNTYIFQVRVAPRKIFRPCSNAVGRFFDFNCKCIIVGIHIVKMLMLLF